MQVRFINKQEEAPDVWSFWFAADEPPVWTAGQSMRLEVEGFYGPTDHRFTISAAPFTQKLAITTRLSQSLFKQALAGLQPGDAAAVYDVSGEFAWGQGAHPRIFAASGIGITPFIAMLRQRAHEGGPLAVRLVHAWPDGAVPFAAELRELQLRHPELQVRYITNQRLDAELLRPLLDAEPTAHLYLSGPEAMVQELGSQLRAEQAISDAQLHNDLFSGLS